MISRPKHRPATILLAKTYMLTESVFVNLGGWMLNRDLVRRSRRHLSGLAGLTPLNSLFWCRVGASFRMSRGEGTKSHSLTHA